MLGKKKEHNGGESMKGINYWNTISKISMEVGSVLVVNGVAMYLLKSNKYIADITIRFSKTKLVIPVICLLISSLSISLIVELFKLIRRLF